MICAHTAGPGFVPANKQANECTAKNSTPGLAAVYSQMKAHKQQRINTRQHLFLLPI